MTERTTAEEFDRVFDAGGDVGAYVDWEHPVESPVLRRPEPVSVTFEVDPELVVAFDRKAAFRGMTRAEWMADLMGAAVAGA
jgi:hypothetical protein